LDAGHLMSENCPISLPVLMAPPRDRATVPSRVVGRSARLRALPTSVVEEAARSRADGSSLVGGAPRSCGAGLRDGRTAARSRAALAAVVAVSRDRARSASSVVDSAARLRDDRTTDVGETMSKHDASTSAVGETGRRLDLCDVRLGQTAVEALPGPQLVPLPSVEALEADP
jgi:hypothetical protein